MTDKLTDEELREACEAAKVYAEPLADWPGWWKVSTGDGYSVIPTKWLIAIVASPLVERVRDMGDDGHWMLAQYIGLMATDTQRIRAAMKVIRGQ